MYNDNGHPLTMTYEGKTYYYLTNYRGDVIAMTDAGGAVVAEYSYDAWGNILTQSRIMAVTNPYRYAGYRYDERTKLYYLMARYYNPDTGVFLSLVPVRGDVKNPLTMNGYNYAIPIAYTGMVVVLGVGLIMSIIQSLNGIGVLLDQSFAKVKVRPSYKSKYEIHHIVAQKAQKAASARTILKYVGLSVQDSVNLISIKIGMHRRLHTTVYYNTINSIMNKVYKKLVILKIERTL